jgi:site-specific DNA-cytosine methylase
LAGTPSDYADSSKRWREAFTIDKAKQQTSKGRSTVAVLFSGGCIDTLAAIRSGFQPIWGTEICEAQQRMWTDLTQSPTIGDTFQNFNNLQKSKINSMPTPDYLTSGSPCPDFSLSGSKSGKDGETGWMYVAQAEPFLLK